jgi:hypothetical protein
MEHRVSVEALPFLWNHFYAYYFSFAEFDFGFFLSRTIRAMLLID